MKIPTHLAIIMDGNGRWARRRMLPRSAGHREGVKALKNIVATCADLGISFLTVYAFSTENWARPKDEVEGIFALVKKFTDDDIGFLNGHNVRLNFIGNIAGLPADVKEAADRATQKTAQNKGLTVNVALNYGAREEILFAVNAAVKKGFEVDAKQFEKLLYTSGQPAPDLIVRTGGEKRLSNFLLYQAAYSELVFTKTLWPDFDKKQLENVLEEYSRRDRRFGRVKAED